jgi:8-oxo-dGTP pyrophosphatase MutT (NUDIX family)
MSSEASGSTAPATRSFVLCVVQRGERFLLIQERKFEQGWYFPAGAVDDGESIFAAAVRETREEAGVHVTLRGVWRIEHRSAAPARLRVFFAAETADTALKTQADKHSLGARWFTRAEVAALSNDGLLRGDEVLEVIDFVLSSPPLLPLSLWQA